VSPRLGRCSICNRTMLKQNLTAHMVAIHNTQFDGEAVAGPSGKQIEPQSAGFSDDNSDHDGDEEFYGFSGASMETTPP
jgi:hypothetical protein